MKERGGVWRSTGATGAAGCGAGPTAEVAGPTFMGADAGHAGGAIVLSLNQLPEPLDAGLLASYGAACGEDSLTHRGRPGGALGSDQRPSATGDLKGRSRVDVPFRLRLEWRCESQGPLGYCSVAAGAQLIVRHVEMRRWRSSTPQAARRAPAAAVFVAKPGGPGALLAAAAQVCLVRTIVTAEGNEHGCFRRISRLMA
ncbi:hypothetical protein ACFXCZ_15010 [Streptomyces sp. NPDC059396]|uniref:hypothetical protein n=1 Tax=Streptomyces sp. NPDC059396 TaxID=3346819 RepID=UPI003680D794